MPWTTPRTWVTGEVLTAGLLNTHLRDNLTWLRDTPIAKVRRTTQSGSGAAAVWEVEDIDTDAMVDLVANNTRITIKTAGWYLVKLLDIGVTSGDSMEWRFHKNGMIFARWPTMQAPASTSARAAWATLEQFAVNDYIEAIAQTAASSFTTGTYLMAAKIRD